MRGANTYRAVRVGDVSDWRLTVYISAVGMSAYLRNMEDKTAPVETLFEETWRDDDTMLLQQIENAVYDHPQVLDDFTADIVICTPKLLWFPASVTETEDATPEELFAEVYPVEAEDVLIDQSEGILGAYTLCSGLPAFLYRTFPGARVSHVQSLIRQRFAGRNADAVRIYVDIREGEADFIIFNGTKFVQGCVHSYRQASDLVYHILNLSEVYGLNPETLQVHLSGKREVRDELIPLLRRHIEYVMHSMVPSFVNDAEMPLGAAIAASRPASV